MNLNPIDVIRKRALSKVFASLPGTLDVPEVSTDSGTSGDRSWKVTIFDNDTNTYQEVIAILMLATECDAEEAYIEAWETDHYGKCDVHFAGQQECSSAALIIAEIGIRVEVSREE